MPRCLIVYFSQTGSTAKIAAAVAAGLRSAEWDIDLCNIKNGVPPDVREYDMLGFGFPVYYFHLPIQFRTYVKSLPALSQKPVFIFLLYGTTPGSAVQEISKILLRKKATITNFFQACGVDYFLGYLYAGWLFSPDNPAIIELGEAELFGRTMALSPPRGTELGGGHPTVKAVLRSWLKFLIAPWLIKIVYSRFFTVSLGRCDKCGLCLRQCPTKNISYRRENGYPAWGRQCIMCFACEQICPNEAIKSPIDWFVFKIIVRYFLRDSLSEPLIQRKRVLLRNGKIELLNE